MPLNQTASEIKKQQQSNNNKTAGTGNTSYDPSKYSNYNPASSGGGGGNTVYDPSKSVSYSNTSKGGGSGSNYTGSNGGTAGYLVNGSGGTSNYSSNGYSSNYTNTNAYLATKVAQQAIAAEKAKIEADRIANAKALAEKNKQAILNSAVQSERAQQLANKKAIDTAKAIQESKAKEYTVRNRYAYNKRMQKNQEDSKYDSALTNLEQQNLGLTAAQQSPTMNRYKATDQAGYNSLGEFWDQNKEGATVAAAVPALMALGGVGIPALGNMVGNGVGAVANKIAAAKALAAASTTGPAAAYLSAATEPNGVVNKGVSTAGILANDAIQGISNGANNVANSILNLSQPSVANASGVDRAFDTASNWVGNNVSNLLNVLATLGTTGAITAGVLNSDQAKTAEARNDYSTGALRGTESAFDNVWQYLDPTRWAANNGTSPIGTAASNLKAAFDTLGEPTPETAWDKINKAQAAEKAASEKAAIESATAAREKAREEAAKKAAEDYKSPVTTPKPAETGSGTGTGTDTGGTKTTAPKTSATTETSSEETSETTGGEGLDLEESINQMRSNYGITDVNYDSLLADLMSGIDDAVASVRDENKLLLSQASDAKANALNNLYKTFTDSIGSGLTSNASTGQALAGAVQAVMGDQETANQTAETNTKQALANIKAILEKKADAPTSVANAIAQLMTPESNIRQYYFQGSDAASKEAAASNYAADQSLAAALASNTGSGSGSGSSSGSNSNVMTQQQMYDYIDSSVSEGDLLYKLSTLYGVTEGGALYNSLYNRGMKNVARWKAASAADPSDSYFDMINF